MKETRPLIRYKDFYLLSPTYLVFGWFLFFLNGCGELHYYYQALSGHFHILNQKQDIQSLIQDPSTPPELVVKLKLIQEVRQFAVTSLSLPEIQGYTEYVDIQKPYVSTLVTAAAPLRLESYEWFYLGLGWVEYRGYFQEEDAEAYAEQLKPEGWDVAIGHAKAYSTLGRLNWLPRYFEDPVLSTFTDRSETAIISTLIHEMAHQVFYISGDTSFNESFAVFVEQEGLRQYLDTHPQMDPQLYQTYLKSRQDKERFQQLIDTVYEKLESLYETDLSDDEKRIEKQRIFDELKRTYQQHQSEFQLVSYDQWFEQPLNNAHILSVNRYNSYVEAFAKIFEEQQRQWNSFFERVKAIAELSTEERLNYLKQFAKLEEYDHPKQ